MVLSFDRDVSSMLTVGSAMTRRCLRFMLKQGVALTYVTLLARCVLPPGVLRCIYECYTRQTTTTDASDHYVSAPYSMYRLASNKWLNNFDERPHRRRTIFHVGQCSVHIDQSAA